MKTQRLIRPVSARGRLMLALFALVVLAGLWPTIAWVNRAILVLGLPLLAVWSCLIVIACTGVMLIGNRLLPLPAAITRAHEPHATRDE